MLLWSVHARNMWLIVSQIPVGKIRSQEMSRLKVRLSQLTTKKVPALALVVVAMLGMVAGVLAANIAVTSNTYAGEVGMTHNNTGVLTFLDNGLSVVSNVPGTTNTSATFLTTGNKNVFQSTPAFAAGHWEEAIQVTDTSSTDTTVHAVKITINSGTTAPSGSTLVTQFTYTMTGVTGSSSPTITLYVDLGVTTIVAPLNVYINST